MKKTAIITGASGGMGRGVAERLTNEGFSLVLAYAGNAAKAEETLAPLENAGGQAITVAASIENADESRHCSIRQ